MFSNAAKLHFYEKVTSNMKHFYRLLKKETMTMKNTGLFVSLYIRKALQELDDREFEASGQYGRRSVDAIVGEEEAPKACLLERGDGPHGGAVVAAHAVRVPRLHPPAGTQLCQVLVDAADLGEHAVRDLGDAVLIEEEVSKGHKICEKMMSIHIG